MRFEAWTLPWSATFERVIADIPVIEDTGRGTVKFSDFGEGSIAVPASYARLDEIVSTTGGSLIRAYEGSVLVHEWVAERTQQSVDNTVINISGGDLLGYSFDRAVIYPYDYPTNPSTQPDWAWGGGNILGNPGFEDSSVTPKVFLLDITATGGTYTLTDGTDTTSAIAYNATAATIATRMETDLGLFTDVIVVQTGSSPSSTFVIQMVTPAFGVNLGINVGSLTGGSGTTVTTQGGGLSPSPWTQTQTLASGLPNVQGFYNEFVVSTAVAHTGSYSLKIDAGDIGPTSNRGAGAQQVHQVVPGGLYQASVWVYPTSATDRLRLGLFSLGEELIGWSDADGQSFTANTWTQITLTDLVIPAGVTTAILRIALTNPGPYDPDVFYVDDGEFYGGLAAGTIGKIAIDLLDDATTDHSGDTRGTILDWVDYTGFSATTDSNAANWDETLSFTVQRGMTYGQWLETVRTLGYEFRLVAKATPSAGKTHNLELYNPLGMDAAPFVGLITGGSIVDGSVSKRIPNYTATLLEGAGGVYDEGVDTTNQTNFGRLEKYLSNNQWGDTTTIGLAEAELFAAEASNLQAIKAELVAGHITPLVDFVPGDTVSFQLPGLVVKNSRRVQQVSYRNAPATVYEVVGSKVFPGQSGVYELVRRLWRRFTRIPEQASGPSVFNGGGGGAITIQIAASDATQESKDKADFVCTGVNDQEVINTALLMLETTTSAFGGGGRLFFSEGTFNIAINQWGISYGGDSSVGVEFVGAGSPAFAGTTRFVVVSAAGTTPWRLVNAASMGSSTYRNIIFDANSITGVAAILLLFEGAVKVYDCAFYGFAYGVQSLSNVGSWVVNSIFDGNGTHIRVPAGSYVVGNECSSATGTASDQAGIYIVGGTTPTLRSVAADNSVSGGSKYGIYCNGYATVHHNTVSGTTSSGIYIGTEGSIVESNNIRNAGLHGIETALNNELAGIRVQGNRIFTPQRHGLFIDVPNALIYDNLITGAGQATSNTYDGIHISHNAARVMRNTVDGGSGQTRYGIRIDTGTGSIVVGNDLRAASDYGTDDYSDAGTSTINTYPAGAIGDNFST